MRTSFSPLFQMPYQETSVGHSFHHLSGHYCKFIFLPVHLPRRILFDFMNTSLHLLLHKPIYLAQQPLHLNHWYQHISTLIIHGSKHIITSFPIGRANISNPCITCALLLFCVLSAIRLRLFYWSSTSSEIITRV